MINYIKKIKSKILEYIENKKMPNVYCKLCSSCGEDGCCSALSCMYKNMVDRPNKKCLYSERYSHDLTFSYHLSNMYSEQIYKLKNKEITTEQFIINVDKEFDEIWDNVYKN